MNRLQKKCILASVVLHGLLLLVILFGAAFFKKNPAPIPTQRINVIPSRLVESALSGGGGNPNLPRTDDQVKGNSFVPQPLPAAAPPTPKPPKPQPRPAPVPAPAVTPPRPEPHRTEPRPEPVKPSVKPADIDLRPAFEASPEIRGGLPQFTG